MLALARALMRGPRLMLIDELSLGVGPLVMQRIYDALRSYSETGVTIVFVEQNVRQALDFADHAYIMNAGRVVASGPAEAFRAESDLAALLVGAGFTREEASGEESYDATPTEQLSEVTSHEPQEA